MLISSCTEEVMASVFLIMPQAVLYLCRPVTEGIIMCKKANSKTSAVHVRSLAISQRWW